MLLAKLISIIFIVIGIVAAVVAGSFVPDVWEKLKGSFPGLEQHQTKVLPFALIFIIIGAVVAALPDFFPDLFGSSTATTVTIVPTKTLLSPNAQTTFTALVVPPSSALSYFWNVDNGVLDAGGDWTSLSTVSYIAPMHTGSVTVSVLVRNQQAIPIASGSLVLPISQIPALLPPPASETLTTMASGTSIPSPEPTTSVTETTNAVSPTHTVQNAALCTINTFTISPSARSYPVDTLLTLHGKGQCAGSIRASRFNIGGDSYGEDSGASEQAETWRVTEGKHTICFEIAFADWEGGAKECFNIKGIVGKQILQENFDNTTSNNWELPVNSYRGTAQIVDGALCIKTVGDVFIPVRIPDLSVSNLYIDATVTAKQNGGMYIGFVVGDFTTQRFEENSLYHMLFVGNNFDQEWKRELWHWDGGGISRVQDFGSAEQLWNVDNPVQLSLEIHDGTYTVYVGGNIEYTVSSLDTDGTQIGLVVWGSTGLERQACFDNVIVYDTNSIPVVTLTYTPVPTDTPSPAMGAEATHTAAVVQTEIAAIIMTASAATREPEQNDP